MARPKKATAPAAPAVKNTSWYGEKPEYPPMKAERWAFLMDAPRDTGGLGRYQHLRNFIHMLLPGMTWNPWLEKMLETFCAERWVCLAGCASSGKTFGVALYSVFWWLVAPGASSVILTSTTKGMIRKRAWGVVQQLYSAILRTHGPLGNMVDSKTTWQSRKGDDKNAIFAIAVESGNLSKAVDQIKGIHTPRQLVIIDEATSTPAAVFEAAANLWSSPKEFQMIVVGNPVSKLDQMGRFAEPLDGWNSVTVDDEEWRTVLQLDGKPGVCVRFDAEKSPNMMAGTDTYSYLVKNAAVAGARQKLGPESPRYWTEYRGFWPPEGLCKTVLTESIISRMNMMGRLKFSTGRTFKVAGFDPAFGGGDKPRLRFAIVGDIEGGGMGVHLTKAIDIPIKVTSVDPVHFQLARQVRAECEQEGVHVTHLAVDATGEGGGLCDIIERDWGRGLVRTEFGGLPTERSASNVDPRSCREIYDRRVTELWFQVREFGINGRLSGLEAAEARQFCERQYDDDGRKIKIERKEDMRKRTGRSPDEADAVALVIEAARYHGASADMSVHHTGRNSWDDMATKYNNALDAQEFYADMTA